MIELTKEETIELLRMANEHSNKVTGLYETASEKCSNLPYIKGVRDGVMNTSYSSFVAGAKAVLKLLNITNEQTD